MTQPGGTFVRGYVDADRDRVLAVLADSFEDFPPVDAITGTGADARERRLRLFEMDLAPAARHHVLVAGTDAEVAGVLTYVDSPRCGAMSAAMVLSFIRLAGPRIFSVLGMYRKIDRVHPREPHRHLVAVGIDPAHQGAGLGGALLSRYAQGCDDDGIDGYLESIRWADESRPSHERFYERYGFRLAAEIPFAAGWTGLTMLRPPTRRGRSA